MAPMLSNETYSQPRQIRDESLKMELSTVAMEEPISSLQSLLAMTSSSSIFKADVASTRTSVITLRNASHSVSRSLSSSTNRSSTLMGNGNNFERNSEVTLSNSADNPSSTFNNANNSPRNTNSSYTNLGCSPSNRGNSPSNLNSSATILSSSHSNSSSHMKSSPSNIDRSPSNRGSSPSNMNSSPTILSSSHSNSSSHMNSPPSNKDSSPSNRENSPNNLNTSPSNLNGSPSNMDLSPNNLNRSPSNIRSPHDLPSPTSPPNSTHSGKSSSHDIVSSSPSTNSTSPSSSPSCLGSSQPATGQTFADNLSTALTELGAQEQSQEMQTSKACTVCGEPTRGIYYGAVTCLPCKTFFVRYSGETRTMKCRTGRRNCDINEATRVSCKACRYAKCLSAGMRRKERPEKQLPLRGQPICAVCGDSANGLHFGVFTCEGCKKFFRRGLEEHISYKCKHSLACRMNPRTRNLCRLCRFQRCVEVGMSLEGIRFGRRKKQKNVESASTCSSSSDTDITDQPPPYNDLPYQPEQYPTIPMDLSPSHHRPGSISDGASSCSSPRSSPGFQETCQQSVPHSFFPYRSAAEGQPTQHPEQCNYDNSQTQKVFEQTEIGSYGGDIPTAAYPLRLREVIETVRESNVSAGPSDDLNGNWDHRPQPEVIQYWQRSVPLEVNSMTSEQRHLISTTLSLYEPQKLCITLDPASNTVTTLPGLLALGNGNVDDGVIQNITSFVIFAKSLPGFDRIHRTDQYTLIRLGSTETRILSSAVFDTRSLDSQLEEAYRQKNHIHFKFLKTTLSISKTVRLLNLDNVESCLLFVLCLIAADRPGLHDGNIIAEVRQQYISALASYIEDNHGDAYSRLSAIFSVMPRVRQMGRWYCELINNIHFALPENRPIPEQLYTTL